MASTSKRPQPEQPNPKQNYLFTFFATLSGVIVGVVAGVGMMGQVVKTQVASATDGLRHDLASMRTASYVDECVGPSTPSNYAAPTARVTTAASIPSVPGGKGSGEEQGGNGGGNGGNWVHYINTIVSDTKGTITNTGADSTNVVKSVNKNTTTITNNNTVTAVNNNHQSAQSGDVKSTENTTAGTAQSGTASNTSSSEFNVEITN